MEVTPKIWDLAAAWLILQETGCPVDVLEGPALFPLQPWDDYKAKSFPTISARNLQSFHSLRKAIEKRAV
jgi:myo-inositol-1(or 4)-monophosphatase